MKNFLLLCFFTSFFLAPPAWSQAPGFMGKRFFIEGQVGANVLFMKLASLYTDSENTSTYFSAIPHMSLNYVISRQGYLALETESRSYYDNEYVDLDLIEDELRFKTHMKSYALGYYTTKNKQLYGGSLAPIGRYHGYKILYSRLTTTPDSYPESGDIFEGEDLEEYNDTYQELSGNVWGFAITYGSRTIVKEKITLSFAMDFGFTGIGVFDYDYDSSKRTLYIENINSNLGMYLNFNLGAGYLLF